MKIRFCMLSAFMVALLLAWGCSDDSTAPDGAGTGGAGGEFAAALDAVDQEYFAGHAAAFRSLDYFGPHIESLVAPRGAKAGCFPNLVAGTVYVYDGVEYLPSERPGAGPVEVRFVLYAVDDQGQLDLATEIGHFWITCDASAGLELSGGVVMLAAPDRPVLQFTLTGSGGSYVCDATIGSAGSGSPLSLAFQADAIPNERAFGVTIESGWMTIAYGMRHYLAAGEAATVDSTEVGFAAYKINPADYLIVWEVGAHLIVSAERVISKGDLIRIDESGNGYFVGCFSGPLDLPVLQPAATAQCEQIAGEYEVGGISSSELNRIRVGFMAMTAIYDTLVRFFTVGMAVGGA